jgi:GNAT superfamily N-acetyltransferase
MKIGDATPEDAARIAELHAASWRTAYRGMLSDTYLDGDLVGERTRLWIERLTNPEPKQRVLIAEIDQELVGFACAYGSNDPQLGTLLDNLHVNQEFQRQGIGTRLMGEIASWCYKQMPGEGLFLWVIERNLLARNFYERRGAVIAGKDIWSSPDGGAIPSLCYAWKNLEPLLAQK